MQRGGHFYRAAKRVAQTGESRPRESHDGDRDPAPPIEPYRPPAGDPEIDLPLWDDDPAPLADNADNNEEEEVNSHLETREEYAARCVAAGVAEAAIAEALQEHYGVSRATAYRILARVPGRRRPAA